MARWPEGQVQLIKCGYACFKHNQALRAWDVWRMKVEVGPYVPCVGWICAREKMALARSVPQVQFNEDGVWHDFASDEEQGRTALNAGLWSLS
jgi:hypothetical protein